METFSAETFALTLALVGMVIMVAALISGLIERSNLPQVAVFLAIGAAIGPAGLGLVDITLDSPVLRVVATLSLALVLFTDAVGLNIKETLKHSRLALLVLGPGTLLTAALISLAGWWLLGIPLPAAILLGAALASTDPVLLRGLLRRRDIPTTARLALRLESGLNDAVLLPVVLVAMLFMSSTTPTGGIDWGKFVLDLFVLGPGAGVAVGLIAVATLDLVRRHIGVRRDYESIYSLGVAFAAFAAAESLHGSGFLAAFAAGLTIASLDGELCDCYHDYGETTAEMALLFTFILFGSSLIWSGLALVSFTTLLFVALVFLFRPAAFLLALARTKLTRFERFLISWFGPRGLSTLLLVLLPVFAGIPGSQQLFAISSLVVLLSVVVHGGSLMFVGRGLERKRKDDSSIAPPTPPAAENLPAQQDGRQTDEQPVVRADSFPISGPTWIKPPANGQTAKGSPAEPTVNPPADADRITIDEMQQLQGAGEKVIVVDARTERTYENSGLDAAGAVRIVPSMGGIAEQASKLRLPRDAWLAIFCA
jgi:NhaP-type Na+/H+ or K+/H+ antiporter